MCRDSTISARSTKAVSENEIISSLPTEESERSRHLIELAVNSLENFIDSHSLQVKFPKYIGRAIEEGRKKKKKLLATLAFAIALKALILAKIALLSHFMKGHHGQKSALVDVFQT